MSTTAASVALVPSSFEAQFFNFSQLQKDQTFSILSIDVDPKLQKLCGETDYPIECLTSTIPFLDENVAINPCLFSNKTKETLDKAFELSVNPPPSRLFLSCLETCIDNYNSILESKKKILDAIPVGDANQVSMELSFNMENVFACEDTFKEAEIESSITELNSLLVKIITNNIIISVDMINF
ncbi:Pectinesterase inhibitor [Gossypium australe]|uniref:Pectinesterase inhibitor n=1 Tax=Gossypium australe TaxID=47621 RepID=A0A5B6U932_9ROSI|nr:Pectinesterase inhibitor [Gossypium australe]